MRSGGHPETCFGYAMRSSCGSTNLHQHRDKTTVDAVAVLETHSQAAELRPETFHRALPLQDADCQDSTGEVLLQQCVFDLLAGRRWKKSFALQRLPDAGWRVVHRLELFDIEPDSERVASGLSL